MAYQNVGRPRFYVNALEWLASIGMIEGLNSVFRTLPVDPSAAIGGTSVNMGVGHLVDLGLSNTFFAALGHTSNLIEVAGADVAETDKIAINYGSSIYNGFTIVATSGSDYVINFEGESDMGSFINGIYYDMPHSPDLNLSMSREMDGVKLVRARGGSDLINYKYTKPTMWGDNAAPWELYSTTPTNQGLARSGRRIWNLSFSSLQSSDIFPDVSSLTNYETSGWSDNQDVTANTLLGENTFYSQVIHKTNGGHLPFIFQPDKNNNNPDQFAICKFDMKSFQFSQTANSVYNISLKIKEVW